MYDWTGAKVPPMRRLCAILHEFHILARSSLADSSNEDRAEQYKVLHGHCKSFQKCSLAANVEIGGAGNHLMNRVARRRKGGSTYWPIPPSMYHGGGCTS